MVDVKRDSYEQTGDQSNQSIFVDKHITFTTFDISRISKVFQSQDGKVSRSTTVRSRTITRTNQAVDSNVQTSDFTGVNGSTVIATGSGSSPSVNSFATNLNTHGVFGINAFNALPTHSDLIKWISDSDSFIKEFDLWTVQNKINQRRGKNSPGCCEHTAMNVTYKDALNNHDCDNYVGNESAENTASGPEDIKITHVPILSQKSEASHV